MTRAFDYMQQQKDPRPRSRAVQHRRDEPPLANYSWHLDFGANGEHGQMNITQCATLLRSQKRNDVKSKRNANI